MKIFVIVTASMFSDCDVRKQEYTHAILRLREELQKFPVLDYEMIIVENNGYRPTFFDDFGCKVLYTNNNSLPTGNKGIKELQDVKDCIQILGIQPDDFVVKITGRYVVDYDSEFIRTLDRIRETEIECIIRYGSFMKPADYQMEDCITGLIGMKSKYIFKIKLPDGNNPIEWDWARATYLIDPKKIHQVTKLGLSMRPSLDKETYFL